MCEMICEAVVMEEIGWRRFPWPQLGVVLVILIIIHGLFAFSTASRSELGLFSPDTLEFKIESDMTISTD